jgi:hypothetical protein
MRTGVALFAHFYKILYNFCRYLHMPFFLNRNQLFRVRIWIPLFNYFLAFFHFKLKENKKKVFHTSCLYFTRFSKKN